MSLVAAKKIYMDAGVAVVLSELDGIFSLKQQQWKALKTSLGGKDSFPLYLWLWQEFSETLQCIIASSGTVTHT